MVQCVDVMMRAALTRGGKVMRWFESVVTCG